MTRYVLQMGGRVLQGVCELRSDATFELIWLDGNIFFIIAGQFDSVAFLGSIFHLFLSSS